MFSSSYGVFSVETPLCSNKRVSSCITVCNFGSTMGLIRTGVLFEIVGTKYSNNGLSCCHHCACGALLYEDALVSIRKVEVEISKIPEPALAVYLVVDGRDTCRVGFLKKNLVKHSNLYVGKLARVNEIYSDESASSI